MPLDRFVIVRTTVSGVNDFGEPVETNTDHRVWAQLVQDGIARGVGEGGVYANADRVWRVRFNQTYVDAIASEGRVIVIYDNLDDPDRQDDFNDTITRTAEPTGTGEGVMGNRRRRFLDLLS